ncbi:MAG: hypothetical protein ACT4QF_01695 [Sporichthyaceae bacterium]
MEYPDVTSWRPGEPEPSTTAHHTGPAATSGEPVQVDDRPPGATTVRSGERPATDGYADIPPAKPGSLTPVRLLTIAILIALAFLSGVWVQKQHTYGYIPPAEAPKEFVPHGH